MSSDIRFVFLSIRSREPPSYRKKIVRRLNARCNGTKIPCRGYGLVFWLGITSPLLARPPEHLSCRQTEILSVNNLKIKNEMKMKDYKVGKGEFYICSVCLRGYLIWRRACEIDWPVTFLPAGISTPMLSGFHPLLVVYL